jgi:hypothetical protein
MKVTVVTAAALVMVVSAQARSGNERHVRVYVCNGAIVPFAVRGMAEQRAAAMFAGIGVTLELREGSPSAAESAGIVIEFGDHTPAELLPGAWAYALPYEGVHIRIFWDRMELERSPRELLAHVMAHEITHILQGSDRHSAEGIMNTRWTQQERLALERAPLHFTEEDVRMIHRGIDSRGAHAPNLTTRAFASAPEVTAE